MRCEETQTLAPLIEEGCIIIYSILRLASERALHVMYASNVKGKIAFSISMDFSNE